MTRFQALCTSLAATIGTGDIAGVAGAIVAGGPGSLFWMWISAFFGMMTSYAEKLLGHCYRRRREDGSYCGGAMMTMEFGLGSRPMGMLYALLCLPVSFGMGNMVQVNAIAQSAEASLRISPLFTAAVLIPALIFCLKQNSTGIGRLNAVLVPVMSIVYMTGAFLILWIGRRQLPAALDLVRDDIFSWRAISVGVARGVFSNEAGLGTSVIAHAQSDVTEPAEQGMWGILEVFLDTIVMCTVTGLVLLVTGICGTSHDGAVLTMDAFCFCLRTFWETSDLTEHSPVCVLHVGRLELLRDGMCPLHRLSVAEPNLSGDLHRNDPSRLLLANADGVASVRSLQRASGHPQSFKSFSFCESR